MKHTLQYYCEKVIRSISKQVLLRWRSKANQVGKWLKLSFCRTTNLPILIISSYHALQCVTTNATILLKKFCSDYVIACAFKKRARENINKNNNKIKIDESCPSFARYFWTTYDTYICFVDEFDERRPFNLHRLSIAIEKLQHKVKKVAFPQIGRWLFGKLNSGDLATGKKALWVKIDLKANKRKLSQREILTTEVIQDKCCHPNALDVLFSKRKIYDWEKSLWRRNSWP